MKKLFLIISVLVPMLSFGQNKIDSLVQVGIQYHDKGEYAKAIEVYNEALKIDPKSTLVNYELSLSYMYLGDNEKAIKHSDFVIKQKKDLLFPSYVAKGSSLSNLGKTKKAIKVFKEGIKKFGNNYNLHFNLGVTYSKIQDNKNAELAFINAITDKPDHASSHYALALIKYQQDERVQSLLSLYYFMFLELDSKRAETAYKLIKDQLGGNVQKDENNPMNFTVLLDPKRMESEFGAAEIMIAMLEASNSLEENKDKTPEELFAENTKSFFSVLGELKENDKQKSNIWWDFYVPFFYDLAKSDLTDVFCYYISLYQNVKAKEWIENNFERFEDFGKWLEENL